MALLAATFRRSVLLLSMECLVVDEHGVDLFGFDDQREEVVVHIVVASDLLLHRVEVVVHVAVLLLHRRSSS